jgi:hypothetical protein
VGPWCPGFEVSHLHAGRRINTVCGFEQACEDDRPQISIEFECLDVLADGVDSGTVVGVEESGFFTILTGNKPRFRFEIIQRIDDWLCPVQHGFGVRLHITGRQRVCIGIVIIGENTVPLAFEGMSDPGGTAKKIQDR